MKKIYHLASCSTCKRIIKELALEGDPSWIFQNIKEEAITSEQLEEMKALAGSYEALFSRRAMKYRSLGLNEMTLTEADYRKYILEEYTFLKRPVLIIDDQIFVGSAKKVVASAQKAIEANAV